MCHRKRLMRYSIVLFDLDGTLLDTLDDLWEAVNHALLSQGLPVRTREEVRNFIGNGIVKLMERAVGEERIHSVDMTVVMERFKEYYRAHCQDKTVPYEGVLNMLRTLRAQGTLIGVVSNKADFAVRQLCEAYFWGLVNVAIGENEAGGVKKKPAPDTLYAALSKLGQIDGLVGGLGGIAERNRGEIPLSSVVYVGDSEVDIQTAKNAGVDCVSVTWGMKSRAFLQENGATLIVDRVEELLGIL